MSAEFRERYDLRGRFRQWCGDTFDACGPFVYNEDGAAPEQPVSSAPPLQSSKQTFASKRIHQLLTEPLLASRGQERTFSTPTSAEQTDGVRRKNSINQVLPFLMKQHAKTLLSIQELQDRVASLEDLSANIQFAMDSSLTKNTNVTANPWSANNLKIEERTGANYSQVVQSSKRSDCGAESDKQDSGLEVDSSHSRNSQTPSSSGGQNLHPLNTHPTAHSHPHQLNPHQNQADELLDLLDQICERGNHLRDYASSQQHLQQLNSDLAGMGDAHLLKENRELKRILQKTEDEKKLLKDQIRNYESQLHRLQGERMAYEDKLSAVCFEKRQLESHVRALHVSCVAGGNSTAGVSLPSGQNTSQAQAESSHLGSFQESPSVNDKVSRVLQMDNPLELQRQLIEHIMDKEALQERLKKLEATWGKRHQDWKKTEEALQSHVDDLMGERDECISALRKNQVDLRRLRSRLTFLESAIQKFDAGNGPNEALDQIGDMALPLPPWIQSSSPRMVQSYHNNLAIGLGERKSPHHSLPPRVGVNQAQNTHALFRNEARASLLSDQWRRLCSPQEDEDDLMSVHDELTSQIDQICSEFDPLSTKGATGGEENHDGPQEYDSLDLSMPLQPMKLHTTFT
ncbi:uncharacterized protein LOC100903893 [Galendromus occidentalis]|uniref:Uncharacterized protein LOC100903893 n=1 Tax=Galendromus occidentalis TaxID=34638 RepID=A0AAJ7SG93_9ACAR|nr:uncharacterized protein LOC100903893 [Galendromus occidentalis]